MSTYADLKGQIATDLRRSNIASEIAQAVQDAIRDHSSERFWFNETATPFTLTMVLQQDIYNITPTATIQEFIKIDRIRSRTSPAATSNWYTLKQTNWLMVEELYSISTNGQ